MSSQRSRLFATLGNLADEIGNAKTAAATKVAGPTPADPGSSHPTASADNGVQSATEGARSSENEADVKKQQGAPSVNSTAEAKPGDDKDKTLNLGTKATLVGDNPAVEDDFKGTKEDPGTSHPAKTEDGQKYAAFRTKVQATVELSNSILADLGLGYGNDLGKQANSGTPAPAAQPAAAAQPNGAAKQASTTPANSAPADAVLAGYELATALGIDKTAAANHVASVIEQSVLDAHTDAALLGAFLTKIATDEDEANAGEDHAKPSGKPEGAHGEPDADNAAPGGAPAAPAADPLAAAGAGGADPMAGAPVGQDEALQELGAALAELGISPEQLVEMIRGGGAGGAPGGAPMDPAAMGGAPGSAPGGAPMDPAAMGGAPMDPAAGGMPPMDQGAKIAEATKLATAVRGFMLSGKYQIKAADTKRARALRDHMKNHLLELMS